MAYIKSYKELIVWQKAIKLVKDVYIITDKYPKSETYGIISQMRRTAIAIPSNIAEGYGRKSSKEYTQFYAIAYGSALELETQIILSKELNYLKNQDYSKIVLTLTEVLKMLNAMTHEMRLKNR